MGEMNVLTRNVIHQCSDLTIFTKELQYRGISGKIAKGDMNVLARNVIQQCSDLTISTKVLPLWGVSGKISMWKMAKNAIPQWHGPANFHGRVSICMYVYESNESISLLWKWKSIASQFIFPTRLMIGCKKNGRPTSICRIWRMCVWFIRNTPFVWKYNARKHE